MIRWVFAFLSIWLPLTIYWGLQPSTNWLMSPLWNSFFLALIGAVALLSIANKSESIQFGGLCLVFVYVMSRIIYGFSPEYRWITPVIDFFAGAFCFAIKQKVAGGLFLVMVINFCYAKGIDLPGWRWQLRNNALFMLQCLTLIGLWTYTLIKSRHTADKKPAESTNVLKMAEWKTISLR